jgi:diguanylate cyclase (GGDEF)-like protein
LELSLQHTEKALGAFRRSLQIREELGDKKGIATCLNRIGVIYTQMGNYPKAQATSEKALHLAEEVTNKSEMINSLEHLADLHAAQGNYQRALQYMREFTRIKDQVFTQESSQKIANLGIVYENQQKQKEIEVQRLKIERQKTIVYLAVVIIGLVLLSLFFLFYRYHLKVRHNLQLEQMNVQLDLLNRTDPLTQLANRRDFVEKIQYEIVRYLRSCKTFSVVLGDIDDFKQINDRHGHQCGDYVLRTVAQLIRAAARGQDVVARWGGEEFILLLPETEPLGGKILSERICAKIAGQRFEHNGQQLKVTMTFGVAAYIDGLRLDDCIARADQAMYKGKIAGKNRVVLLEA